MYFILSPSVTQYEEGLYAICVVTVYCATVLIYIVAPLFSGARFVDEINILFDLC